MAQNADEQAARAQIPALAEGRYRTVSPPGTPLGRGTYGTVVLAFDEQDREYVAIKYLELNRQVPAAKTAGELFHSSAPVSMHLRCLHELRPHTTPDNGAVGAGQVAAV